MKTPEVTRRIIAYNDQNKPLVIHDVLQNRLEILHREMRTSIQLPKNAPFFSTWSRNTTDPPAGTEAIRVAPNPRRSEIPICDCLGRVVASLQQANESLDEKDDVIIIRHRGKQFLILIPKGCPLQVA